MSAPAERPAVRVRDPSFERQFTEQAAKGVADPEALIAHSEARLSVLSGPYVPDPALVAAGRDLARELREELADARAYACWVGEEAQLSGDEDGARRALMALRYVALAYNLMLDED